MAFDTQPAGADAVTFAVHARPGASRDEVGGVHGDALVVKVRAVAEGGKANAAICKALGEALGVPASAVEVVSGATGRRKRVRVRGEGVAARVQSLAARST